MEIINCEQRSPEWYACRLGVPSASNFDKVITTTGKPSTQAIKYMYRLAGEKVSGQAVETYQNASMQRGIELEAEARQLYQIIHDVEVEQVGFCITEGKFIYGCSPDGIITGKKKGLEIKCPEIHTHVGYMLSNESLVSDYFQQINGGLLVTDFDEWDIVSYFPGLKPVIVTVKRDKKYLSSMRSQIESFCEQLEEIINKIK